MTWKDLFKLTGMIGGSIGIVGIILALTVLPIVLLLLAVKLIFF